MSWLRDKTKDIYRILRYAVLNFYKDDGFNLAAGLSFFAILSMIPLAMIVISVLGHMLGQQDQLFNQISHWVEQTLPAVQPEFLNFLRQLVDKKVTSGWLGLAFLFFVASLLFTNIEHILDKVFKNSRARNFWHSRAFSILLLILATFLFFVPNLLTVIAEHLPAGGWIVRISGFITGDITYLIAHGVIFFLLLEFVPNIWMPRSKIILGAVVFAVSTAVARWIFRWYMGRAMERYTFIYGSLSLLVVLIVWLYYLSTLFVFCAEIVSVLQGLYPEKRGE